MESEIALEKELKVDDTMPEAVRSFLEEGQFKIVDKPGNEEVELVRQFGNETYVQAGRAVQWRKRLTQLM